MVKNTFFAFVLTLFLIMPALAIAQTDSPDYLAKQYSTFDLKVPCILNETWCSNAAECNLTMISLSGNGSALHNNSQMTNFNSFMNLTLSPIDTHDIGLYKILTICSEGNLKLSQDFLLEVSSTGTNENSTTFFIILALCSAAIIGFGYLCRDEYMVFLGGIVALILGLYLMLYGINDITNQYSWMLAALICGLGVIFTIKPAYSLIENGGVAEYEEVYDEVRE